MKDNNLIIRDLGVIDYTTSFKMMKDAIQQRYPLEQHELWVVTHPSVYSQGQAGKAEHLLNLSGIKCVQSDRGGQVTYHGPGQVVCYFLFDLTRLGLTVKTLVDGTTDSVINTCNSYDINAFDDPKNPGVYTDQGKIASLGFRIRKHMSYHGVAINFDMDLRPFSGINPCGLKQSISQITHLTSAFSGMNKTQARQQFTQAFIESVTKTFKFDNVAHSKCWPTFSTAN
ncbi:MAG: lipoyl(octanoyl) transferase LipB [Pseudomonadota bacterium]|nr:octanoyltransferase [Gammaproteobacteria bacterium]MEC8011699.1 lipoyl(octanoyl) transferase LipB [Pseudomonadota bacterium]HBF08156.1 octanoyltransferase [Gammaproteobacteria bacterium]|tara:strand:+ start:4565 stop:5248 length:684 start_codon:yes stop_codon:yes gene_type:complete